MSDTDNRVAVILAAGKGTRMKTDLPKVAVPLCNRPMINHVIDNLYTSGIRRFVFILGYKRDVVRSLIPELPGAKMEFAIQEEQNGTAHALLCARATLSDFKGPLVVASGDQPLIRPTTFQSLFDDHQKNNRAVTVLSSVLENPTGYGRLVRNESGELLGIIEEKDADATTKAIRETNTGTYVFQAPDIFDILTQIDTNNVQKEFYLTDSISLFRARGRSVGSYILNDPDEALGANSMEDMQRLEAVYQKV